MKVSWFHKFLFLLGMSVYTSIASLYIATHPEEVQQIAIGIWACGFATCFAFILTFGAASIWWDEKPKNITEQLSNKSCAEEK